ncbi:MAG: DUF433 domain-containing protein [Arcicella sp.]|jgi:uncharacterized protein (DUF433 family)|nr:DUF433 domain-containing protein [Arcicella sp.]
MKANNSVISINPEIMSGEPVFKGTRVPIKTLMDYLIEDGNYEDFLIGFPHISREMVIEVLKELTQRGIPKPKRPKIANYETAA